MCDTLDHQVIFKNVDLFVHPLFSHLEYSILSSTTLVDLKKEASQRVGLIKKSIGVMRQTIFFIQ